MSLSPNFSIVYCSSEESDTPFNGLFKSESPKPWISGTYPKFPIEIIIDLRNLFILNGMDIVSHEYMIASRVDLFGTKDDQINQNNNWFSIGFFQFSDNQRSQWIARELKHILLEHVAVRFLRILIENVHPTPRNIKSQCSFISMQINGRLEIKPRMTSLNDLESDLVDAKNNAVEEENYGAAAVYKDQLLNISDNREELENLFNLRIDSLLKEDYLTVDSVTNQINAILNACRNDSDVPQICTPPVPVRIPVTIASPPQETNQIQQEDHSPPHSPPNEITFEEQSLDKNVTVHDDSFFLTDFEKVAAVATYDEHNDENNSVVDSRKPSSRILSAKKKGPVKERVPKFAPPPPDEPPKDDRPDPLSDADKAEAGILLNLFGEHSVGLAYSKSWGLRVQGFEKLCELILGLKSNVDQIRAIMCMLPLMRRRYSDSLKAVYVAAVDNTMRLLNNVQMNHNDFLTIIHVLLPIAMNKLGDSNQRINEASFEFVIWCSDRDKWALSELISYSVKPPQSPNQYHILLAKMLLISVLMEKYKNDKGRIKPSEIMGLVVPCLDSRKVEVRNAALKIVVDVLNMYGPSMEKYIKNVPRIILEQIEFERSKVTEAIE